MNVRAAGTLIACKQVDLVVRARSLLASRPNCILVGQPRRGDMVWAILLKGMNNVEFGCARRSAVFDDSRDVLWSGFDGSAARQYASGFRRWLSSVRDAPVWGIRSRLLGAGGDACWSGVEHLYWGVG